MTLNEASNLFQKGFGVQVVWTLCNVLQMMSSDGDANNGRNGSTGKGFKTRIPLLLQQRHNADVYLHRPSAHLRPSRHLKSFGITLTHPLSWQIPPEVPEPRHKTLSFPQYMSL